MARAANGVTQKSCRCQFSPPLHNSIEIVGPDRLTELCASFIVQRSNQFLCCESTSAQDRAPDEELLCHWC
jgi:hypothetical protein